MADLEFSISIHLSLLERVNVFCYLKFYIWLNILLKLINFFEKELLDKSSEDSFVLFSSNIGNSQVNVRDIIPVILMKRNFENVPPSSWPHNEIYRCYIIRILGGQRMWPDFCIYSVISTLAQFWMVKKKVDVDLVVQIKWLIWH